MKFAKTFLAFGLALGLIETQARADNEKDNKTNKTTESKERNAKAQTQPTPVVVTEFWTIYIDRLEKESVAVEFPKGSAELPAAEQTRISDWTRAWKQEKDIDKIIVAAWSDEPYPAQSTTRLSEASRDLAEKRADTVEDLIEKSGISDVDTFSMAEKPNWFQKAFATDAAQIKGAVPNKRMDSLNEDRIRKILDAKGGPSKAVIIVKRDMNRQAT
ncbi:MAG TPA: hypothetical protein VFO10_28705 [Oligoflexus sp.]|uniref:hypothetical protein n=1 Tax=Oligoflexus sp. TaxID=1971216 RepID=UPI002D808E11|nr:hypothetical protein [Oligoflexus sp.]HET9241280.1 hypothetical protein [Oligoflexus sp.]